MRLLVFVAVYSKLVDTMVGKDINFLSKTCIPKYTTDSHEAENIKAVHLEGFYDDVDHF